MNEKTITCPNCSQQLPATEEYSGREVPCPSCNVMLKVPDLAVLQEDGAKDITRDLIDTYRARIKDSKIFFAPNIPPKKLKNAVASYGAGVDATEVLLLVDNTAFGGAKDGCMLTEDRILVHNMMETPQSFEYSAMESVIFQEGATCVIHVNETKFLELNMPERAAMRAFTDLLRDITKAVGPGVRAGDLAPAAATGPSVVDALKQIKELYDAGILTEEEFAAKKAKYLEQL